MTERDARARVAAHAGREPRRSVADFVIDSSGTLGQLDGEVDRCWQWIERHAGGVRPGGG